MLEVDALRPEPAAIAAAAAVLRAGGLVAFPTETVYGLGAHALDAEAVGRIFTAKGRPADDPIIVHVLGWEHVPPLVAPLEAGPRSDRVADVARRLATAFWPGPLTLVLPRSPHVPDAVTAGLGSVALRAPDHPVARALLAAADLPIAAPSANPFGRTSPTRAEHVRDELGARVDLILDGGPCPVGVESTIVDVRCDPPRILRPGGVSLEALRRIIPEMAGPADPTLTSPPPDAPGPRTSPGTRLRHYAPRARLLLLHAPPDDLPHALHAAVAALFARGLRVALLAQDEDLGALPSPDQPAAPLVASASLGPRAEPAVAARRLYTALRTVDAAKPDVILATDPGATGLALAVRDRLLRAAEGRYLPATDLPTLIAAAIRGD
jgi:L-threonylcarbamoyladenylate synthase